MQWEWYWYVTSHECNYKAIASSHDGFIQPPHLILLAVVENNQNYHMLYSRRYSLARCLCQVLYNRKMMKFFQTKIASETGRSTPKRVKYWKHAPFNILSTYIAKYYYYRYPLPTTHKYILINKMLLM